MGADNWRELLDDPEVRRLVEQAVRVEGQRVYATQRDALLLDDLESYLWDQAVDIAIREPGIPQGSDRWHAFLYASLRTATNRHRRAMQGAPGSNERDGEYRTTSLDGLAERATTSRAHAEVYAHAHETGPNYLFSRRLSPEDPLGRILYFDRLESMLTHAQRRATSYVTESVRTCSEPMCTEAPVVRGKCRRHYRLDTALWSTNTCTVPDCGAAVVARGMCGTHYAQARRRNAKEWADERAQQPATCTADDCDRPPHGHGLCLKHWKRARRGAA